MTLVGPHGRYVMLRKERQSTEVIMQIGIQIAHNDEGNKPIVDYIVDSLYCPKPAITNQSVRK